MFRPQAQAETHRDPAGPLRASRRPCAEAHSNRRGLPLASASGTYFFFYLYIDYKHKHTATGLAHHVLRALCRNLFFFIYK